MKPSPTLRDLTIGVDVGGTKIIAGLVDPRGEIVAILRRSTDVTSPAATIDCIVQVVEELISSNRINRAMINAIGIGVPGFVDAENGIGIASVNLNWENIPVREELESRLGIRCVVDNDVKASAIGEARFGAGKGKKYLFYLNVGTGISAVFLCDGQLLRGANGFAGEIGHAVIVPHGPLCKCGGHGCLEAVASGPAIEAKAMKEILNGRDSVLARRNGNQVLSAESVFEAAVQGDQLANEILMEVGELLALTIQRYALAYNPDVIVLGGGVLQRNEILFRHIYKNLEVYADESWVFRRIFSPDLVKLSFLDNKSGVLGAAALVNN